MDIIDRRLVWRELDLINSIKMSTFDRSSNKSTFDDNWLILILNIKLCFVSYFIRSKKNKKHCLSNTPSKHHLKMSGNIHITWLYRLTITYMYIDMNLLLGCSLAKEHSIFVICFNSLWRISIDTMNTFICNDTIVSQIVIFVKVILSNNDVINKLGNRICVCRVDKHVLIMA